MERIRSGDEAAFEVVFERYGKGVLSFCRHMLGSLEEAEDAVQHTFASAYADLQRPGARELRLKPWLYTIARNRCLSMLRSRREELAVEYEPPVPALAEQIERRAELRELLLDIEQLPDEQRAALLLAEVADMSHMEIADVLGCEVPRVKALVFRARSSLIERRDARETSCEEIREQLAVLSGGSLRRSVIRHHLSACAGCRDYREKVKHQRRMLAAVLPVAPPVWLKSKVLAAAGAGGSAASGLGGAGGASVAGLASAGAGAAAPAGSALLVKTAVLAVLVGGGTVATRAALNDNPGRDRSESHAAGALDRAAPPAWERVVDGAAPSTFSASEGRASGHARADGQRGASRSHGERVARGPAAVPGSRGLGAGRRSPQASGVPRGRGAPAAPPASPPATRGPVTKSPFRQAPTPAPAQPDRAMTPDLPPPADTHGGGPLETR